MRSKLEKYILSKGLSFADASRAVGLSYDYFHRLVKGQAAGRNAAVKINKWSKGSLSVFELMFPGKKP